MPAGKVLVFSLHHLSDYELQGCHFFWYITYDGTDITIKRESYQGLSSQNLRNWAIENISYTQAWPT